MNIFKNKNKQRKFDNIIIYNMIETIIFIFQKQYIVFSYTINKLINIVQHIVFRYTIYIYI